MTDDFISRVIKKKSLIDKENLEIAEMFAVARNNAESLYQLVNSYADLIEENGVSLDRTKYLVIDLKTVLLKVSLEKRCRVEILYESESLSLEAGREMQGIEELRHKKQLLNRFLERLRCESDFAQVIEQEFIFQLEELCL